MPAEAACQYINVTRQHRLPTIPAFAPNYWPAVVAAQIYKRTDDRLETRNEQANVRMCINVTLQEQLLQTSAQE